ncbi:MAG: hypothetical protein GX251_00455 [Firmicutes bacterium]|nr:hypothetical protein [Bacillota bacterium]
MDKFYRGFTAGVLGAVPLNLWSLFSYHVLKLTDLRMLDWAGMAIYGTLPRTLLQVVSSLVMQLVWSGFRGILFAYLVPEVRSWGYVGKAVIFSLIVSFFEGGVAMLFKVPHLSVLSSGTVLSANLGSLLWGVLLGYFCRRLAQLPKTEKAG